MNRTRRDPPTSCVEWPRRNSIYRRNWDPVKMGARAHGKFCAKNVKKDDPIEPRRQPVPVNPITIGTVKKLYSR